MNTSKMLFRVVVIVSLCRVLFVYFRLLVLLTIKQGLSKIQKQIKKIMMLMPPVTPPSSRPNTLEKKQVRHNPAPHTGSHLHPPPSYLARLRGCLFVSGSFFPRSYMIRLRSGYLLKKGSFLAIVRSCFAGRGSCRIGSGSGHAAPGSGNADGSCGYLSGARGCLAHSRDYLGRSVSSYLGSNVSSYLGFPVDLLEMVEEAYLLQDMT